jgi:hypothetical protein
LVVAAVPVVSQPQQGVAVVRSSVVAVVAVARASRARFPVRAALVAVAASS